MTAEMAVKATVQVAWLVMALKAILLTNGVVGDISSTLDETGTHEPARRPDATLKTLKESATDVKDQTPDLIHTALDPNEESMTRASLVKEVGPADELATPTAAHDESDVTDGVDLLI